MSTSRNDHRRIEERSVAMHRLVAEKLMTDPGLLERARRNLNRWRAKNEGWSPALKEWDGILCGDFVDVARFIVEPSERATRLRQSSPFCGILSDEERRAVYESYSARAYHSGRKSPASPEP